MKLVSPTDFQILEFLRKHGRNNAVNLAAALERDSDYIDTRLRTLANEGLVERIGPAENSGLYDITEYGRAAIVYRDAFEHERIDFETVIEDAIDQR